MLALYVVINPLLNRVILVLLDWNIVNITLALLGSRPSGPSIMAMELALLRAVQKSLEIGKSLTLVLGALFPQGFETRLRKMREIEELLLDRFPFIMIIWISIGILGSPRILRMHFSGSLRIPVFFGLVIKQRAPRRIWKVFIRFEAYSDLGRASWESFYQVIWTTHICMTVLNFALNFY